MTQKLSVVYKAPPGDSKVCEAWGYTFFDGKPEDIEVSDEIAEKIKSNRNFAPGGTAKEEADTDHGRKHK
jgi:hypothetical protein